MLYLHDADGKIQFDADKAAARSYFLDHVNQNTVWHTDLEEKLAYLFDKGYYEREVFEQYTDEFVKGLFKQTYAHRFRFATFLGAFKAYPSYVLKTFDGKRYLERWEDRVAVTALYLARGDENLGNAVVRSAARRDHKATLPSPWWAVSRAPSHFGLNLDPPDSAGAFCKLSAGRASAVGIGANRFDIRRP